MQNFVAEQNFVAKKISATTRTTVVQNWPNFAPEDSDWNSIIAILEIAKTDSRHSLAASKSSNLAAAAIAPAA